MLPHTLWFLLVVLVSVVAVYKSPVKHRKNMYLFIGIFSSIFLIYFLVKHFNSSAVNLPNKQIQKGFLQMLTKPANDRLINLKFSPEK